MSSYDLWAKNGVHMQCKEWWIPFGDFLKISWMLRKNKRIFVKTSKISEKKLSHNTLQKSQKNPTKLQELHRTSAKSTLPQWLERSTSQPQLKKALEAKMVPKWPALREWWAKNWRLHKDGYMVVVHKPFLSTMINSFSDCNESFPVDCCQDPTPPPCHASKHLNWPPHSVAHVSHFSCIEFNWNEMFWVSYRCVSGSIWLETCHRSGNKI